MRAYSITHRSLVDFQFLGAEQQKGGFIQQQAMSFGWSNFAIKMKSTQASNNRGTWYVPEIEMIDSVPEDQQEIVAKWFEVFSMSQVDSKESAIHQLSSGE